MAGLNLSLFLAVLLALGVGTLLIAFGLMFIGGQAALPGRSLSKASNNSSFLHTAVLRLLGENDAKRQDAARRRLFQAGFAAADGEDAGKVVRRSRENVDDGERGPDMILIFMGDSSVLR